MGVYELTDIVYVCIAICFTAAMAYTVWYSLQQRKRMEQMERDGVRPATLTEAIIEAQRYKPRR